MDKSKRAPNFSKAEELSLISLVNKYHHVVQCKKTDVNSAKAKERIWNLISKEFNDFDGSTIRDALTLRRKYDNLKKRSKKLQNDEKWHSEVIADSVSPAIICENIDEDIKPVLGDPLGGVPSMYDSDVYPEEVSVTSPNIITVNEEDIITQEWSECTPDMLKSLTAVEVMESREQNNNTQKNSTKSRPHKRKTSDEIWTQVGKAKLELISEQQKCMREEHEMKLKFLENEHNLKMELLQLEIEIKKKQL